MAQLSPEFAIELADDINKESPSDGEKFHGEKLLKEYNDKNWAAVLKEYELLGETITDFEVFNMALEAAVELEQSRLVLKIFTSMPGFDRMKLPSNLLLKVAKTAQLIGSFDVSETILNWIREREGLPKLASLETKLEEQFSSTAEMDRFYYRMENHSSSNQLLTKASMDDWMMYGFLCMNKGDYDKAQQVLVQVRTETTS